MPFARCSSADISEAVGAADRAVGGGRIVLAVSLVVVETGVLPRPLGASSEDRGSSIEGLSGLEGACGIGGTAVSE